MLRTIQHAWPQTAITWIIGKTEAALIGDIPGVEFIVFDKARGLKAYRDLFATLRGRRFDVLLHMQISLRASLASLAVRAPIRVGFDRKRARNGQWLFTNRKIRAAGRQHVLDSFMEFPKALGLSEAVLNWDIPVPQEARHYAEEILPLGQPYMVVNPCSSVRARNFRNWTIEGYAAVIDHAASRHGIKVVLTGGPSSAEQEFCAEICRKTASSVLNLVGKTTLKQLQAVLARAEVVIAPDTGPTHMANAARTPVIGLYATTNPERAAPYLFPHLVVNRYPDAVRQLDGKTVQEVRWGHRVRNPEAMALITIEDVTTRLDAFLEQAATKP